MGVASVRVDCGEGPGGCPNRLTFRDGIAVEGDVGGGEIVSACDHGDIKTLGYLFRSSAPIAALVIDSKLYLSRSLVVILRSKSHPFKSRVVCIYRAPVRHGC